MFVGAQHSFISVAMPLRLRSVFFFQAEDGIRDVAVTGVQTCALPISRLADHLSPSRGLAPVVSALLSAFAGLTNAAEPVPGWVTGGQPTEQQINAFKAEIGRASCRGKSVDLGGRRIIKKKSRRMAYRD